MAKAEDAHILSHEFKDIDDSEVTPQELRAWYLFGGCADPIAFCQGFFIPLIVQGLAASGGFKTEDHSVACDTSISGYSCVVPVGSGWMDVSSFYFMTVVVSTILQLVLFIGLGSIADHGPYRKKFMLGFSLLGSVACILFLAIVQKGSYWMAAILTIVAGVSLGSTWVFNYAFIPPLARNHPTFLAAAKDPNATRESLLLKLDEVTNYISSISFVYMYAGTLVLLVIIVGLAFVLPVPSSFPADYAYHAGVGIGGIIWLVGVVIAARGMRDRPGPAFPEGENVVLFSTKKEQLGFSSTEILILAAEVPILALFGSWAWNKLQTRFGISSKRLLLVHNTIYTVVVLWGCLGFTNMGIGYKTKIELFIAATLHGLILGATQSTCRSLFAQLLPSGHESKFFSLYEIVDKGSAWVGPLVVAAIGTSGANKSWQFVFLAAQFGLGMFLFSRVDVVAGVEEGKVFGALEREREEAKKNGGVQV
ncbi:autophagy-related protein 22-like protein [Obelidium mucronatum]|nr:autophagy-related protein 22-like protein [Obelidium mucronatum]